MKKFYFFFLALIIMKGAMAQWVPQNSGILSNLNSVFFIDPDNGYAVGNKILKTTDGGNLWNSQALPVGEERFDVFFTSIDTGYAAGAAQGWYGGGILKTTDAGTNWNDLFNYDHSAHSLFFTDSYTGYAGGTNYWIRKTTDGGMNWSNISPQGINAEYISSIFFIDDINGFAVTSDPYYFSYILKTTNGGNDWSIKDTCSGVGGLKSIYFTDGLNGYAVGGVAEGGSSLFGFLHKTTNGGEDWIDTTFYFYQPGFADVFFTDLNTGYIVGQDGLILKTTDAGDTWFEQYSGTTSTLRSVYFPTLDTGYIVGDSGIILKTTNGGGNPVGINYHHQTSNMLIISPNPATDLITIQTPLHSFLTIHSINGHQVLQKEVTETKTTVDLGVLPSGIYIVKLIGEKRVQVGKMVKK